MPPGQLRALIIAEADLGERIVRALILRRVGLIEAGASGPVLIGAPQSPACCACRTSCARNGQPHHVVDAHEDADAAALMEQYGAAASEVLVVCPDGSVLLNPSEADAGALPRHGRHRPRTTSSSTWPWSAPGRRASPPRCTRPPKGCSVVVLDCRAYGGQAGASARIENYLGFPDRHLRPGAGRPRLRAGAEVRRRDADPGSRRCRSTARASTASGELAMRLTDGRRLRSRTRRHRQRRALPPPDGAAPERVRRPRRLVLGLGARGDACARRPRWCWSAAATRPGRRRCSWRSTPRACTCWCAARAWRPACRAT